MENKYNILLCEDDENLGAIIRGFLQFNHYNVVVASDGEKGYEIAKKKKFDLAILDVMMPKMNGFELAEKLSQSEAPHIPIIFLSAKNQKEDILKGYQSGATDYITKPFDSELLLHKIEALVKRWKVSEERIKKDEKENLQSKTHAYVFDKYKFSPHARELHADGKMVLLTPKEASLLDQFCRNEGKLIEKTEILSKIWGKNTLFGNRSMNVFLVKIRKKFKDDPGITIKNLYNSGYKFSVKGGVKVVPIS